MTIPCKLLLVDDNMEHVRLMKNELKKINVAFDTQVIYLKKDFLPTLEQFKPHIIIADYGLAFSGLDAYGLAEQLGREVSFIAVADELSDEEVEECYRLGLEDCLLWADLRRLCFSIKNIVRRRLAEFETNLFKRKLKTASAELKFFVENYENVREEEKMITSRELHDELGQILTALKIDIKLLRRKVFSENHKKAIELEFDTIIETINTSTNSVRKIAAGLRPDMLDKLGLIDAVEWLAEETSRRYGLKCRTILPESISFSNEYFSVTLYRIVQETLTNVVRHAEASEVLIEMKIKGDSLYLTINDNGIGINKEKMSKATSLGIIGLRERVHSLQGQLNIIGSESEGTVVSVIIPTDAQITNEKV